MAEARSAVGKLRVFPDLEEGRDSWKDVYTAIRKSLVRRFFRTRNSIHNGTWPTSTNNLSIVFAITFGLLLAEPVKTVVLNKLLWNLADVLPIPDGTPRWFRAFITAWVVGLVFFVVLMKLRQYALRALLSYRGWLYENLKSQSGKTVLWGVLVKMISGYSPSLYSCQRSLPRLPVPNVHQTLVLLLDSLKPLCTQTEHNELIAEAAAFENSALCKKLQRILILKSWWMPNYVSDWWEKYVYLMSRSPLAINSNYYGMDQSYWTPTNNQTARAATIIYNILVFKRMIDREELAPLLIRNTIPICMSQYERLFSSIRVPGEKVDKLRHCDSADSKHIVVNYLGMYYRVECYDIKNQILSPSAIQTQFEWIMNQADSELKSGKRHSLNKVKIELVVAICKYIDKDYIFIYKKKV
ncbi:Carnitine O-palmitoyltransferase 1, liver isoform [Folsomia candida]|uniref:Carnitine O-palmitoyltransferase 1, liver isoform n=1 Tax=Folsomia candida TaxID=158441 RepID=A0A226EZ82_FOLCA|nr:Carnitine O-palmitoyltransferase 1, liver isoform [Folsomia candida]